MVVDLLLWGGLLIILWVTFFSKPSGTPPGRWGLPLIGYIPFTRSIDEQVEYMRQKYGQLYLWRIGTQVIVFLNDVDLVKEAFNRADFTDRPDWVSFRFMEKEPLGVIGSDGLRWHNNRRFTLRRLRDLGMGKSKLVAAVHTQTINLVQELKKQAGTGRPVPLPHALAVAPLNIIWEMVAGKHFLLTDPKLEEFEKVTDDFTNTFIYMAVPDFLPWLHNVLPSFLLRRIFRFELGEALAETLSTFLKEVLEEHKASLDRDNPKDLIDSYLIEIEERNDDPDNTFCEKDLLFLIVDLFFAGRETAIFTLVWMIYYLAINPQAQRKMQAEIDEVLPRGTMATTQDEQRLPYVEAVIHETMRKSALVGFGVPHMAAQDTTLRGYTIPKGTILLTNMVSIHHDPSVWDNPQEFRPERWLDENGMFRTSKAGFLPFNLGKRKCLGEGLARVELFVFSAAIFQNVSFAVPPGKTLNLTPVAANPFLRRPVFQDLIITVRD